LGRCSLWVGREVLLVMRFEQRSNSWPHYSSERLGEGVDDLVTGSQCKLAPFFIFFVGQTEIASIETEI
jgi:hypothetical protein